MLFRSRRAAPRVWRASLGRKTEGPVGNRPGPRKRMPCLRPRHPRRRRRTWLLTGKIRVNVIAPGPIDTAAVAEIPQGMKKAFAAMVPLGRFGQPEEIAGPALFLASDDSTFVTGIELTVDGGLAQV